MAFSALFDELESRFSPMGDTPSEEGGYPKHSDVGTPPAPESETAVGPEINPPSGKGELPVPSGYTTFPYPGILDYRISGDNEEVSDTRFSLAPSPSLDSAPFTDPENTRISTKEMERLLAVIDPRLLEPWEPTTPPELDEPVLYPLEELPKVRSLPLCAKPDTAHTNGSHLREE